MDKFIIILLLIFLVVCIYNIQKHNRSKKLLEKVQWCTTSDSSIYRCNLNLIDWLCNIPHYSQKKQPDSFFPNADKLFLIQEKYNIRGEEERKVAQEILKQYQQELSQSYYSGQVCTDNYFTKIKEAEFFLITLAEFLKKHQCEKEFNGHKMYITKSYKDCGCYGGPLFDATYELTDYAVIYHKMYYIAQMYCLTLRKKPHDTDTLSFKNAEYTKKVIDTREMEVSRY